MSEKKQLLIAAGIVVAVMVVCMIVLMTDKKPPAIPETASIETPLLDPRVTIHEQFATIAFADESVVIPAPPGYCFADQTQEIDRALIKVIADMQTSYGNHLWLAYANCEQLKAVRVSRDMNAYIATGMLVTPLTLLEEKTSAQVFTGHLRQQIQALDPVAFETLVNGAAQKNMSKDIEIKSGQPLIFRDTLTDLIFMLRHELTDPSTGPFTITEFDVVTSIKDRPLVAIFTYKDLTDPTEQKAFSEAYLAELIAANAAQTAEPVAVPAPPAAP